MALDPQYLYRPLVEKLGLEARVGESVDVTQLRTLALTALSEAEDHQCVDMRLFNRC